MNFKSLLYLVFALLGTTALQAQDEDFRKQAPEGGPPPRIEFGEYQQFKLDNGLEVIVVENHKLPKVTLQLLIDVPPKAYGDKVGMASMAGEMLSRGTANRSKNEIDEAVDFIGASLSTSSGGAYATSLSKHKETLIELMADAILNPVFPEEEFDKLLQQRISSLALQTSDPGYISSTVSDVLRYGAEHPYGEIETKSTLENIKLEDLKTYYQKNFKPNISYLALIGDIKPDEAKALAEEHFGSWEKGNVAREFYARPKVPEAAQVALVNKDAATQSVLNITYPVNLKPGTDDAIVANVLNTILGGGLLSSRLNQNIREDKGYSYGVRSTLQYDKVIGYFAAGGNVRNEVTDSAVVEMLGEMEKLRQELVPEKELNSVKSFIFGSFARSTERPETAARFALNIARYKLPKDYYTTYLKRVQEVTPERLQEAAQKYLLPEQAYIVVVGNAGEVAEPLQRIAPVLIYDNQGRPVDKAGLSLPDGLTATDVIDQYIEALGGKEKLEGVKDVSMTMGASIQGMELTMKMKQKATGKMAMTVEMNGSVVNETRYDGEKAMVSAMGQKQVLEGADAEAMKSQAIIYPELEYAKKGYELKLTGAEKVGDDATYKVEITSPDGTKSTEYFSIESGLKLKAVTTQEGPQGTVTITNSYSDYTEVEGILFPFETVSEGMAPVPLNMKVSEVKINTGIEDEVFKVSE
ncbi:MAG: pitrilysin family protein [Phaeodactylibacter sp.]|uniref:M16 family metallopeptidase n=1 Tax=Phaeodactylibacter sp. TaxID=1940289 RepID=UPI0032EF4491